MSRPTPSVGTAGIPNDQVCKLPDPDPLFMVLVYYTPEGRPSWQRRIPISADLEQQSGELLRDGREWYSARRRRSVYLVSRGGAAPTG